MSIKQRLLKLETLAAASTPTENNPAEHFKLYQCFYPDTPMSINPDFKFKHEGQLTLTDAYDFFENGLSNE